MLRSLKLFTPPKDWKRTRILIADDHTLIADLCKKLLEPEFEVVGTVSDGRAMVRAATQCQPDVIVADIGMPLLNGLDAGRQVKEDLPLVKLAAWIVVIAAIALVAFVIWGLATHDPSQQPLRE